MKIKDFHPTVLKWAMERNIIMPNELENDMTTDTIGLIEGAYEHSNGMECDDLIRDGRSVECREQYKKDYPEE